LLLQQALEVLLAVSESPLGYLLCGSSEFTVLVLSHLSSEHRPIRSLSVAIIWTLLETRLVRCYDCQHLIYSRISGSKALAAFKAVHAQVALAEIALDNDEAFSDAVTTVAKLFQEL
jgi:hypothetical protein